MKFATLILSLVFGFSTLAEEGKHSIGIQGGHVGQTGTNVGSDYGDALGYGAFFNYAGSDFLELQINYLQSKHTKNSLNLDQQVIGASAIYIIDQLDAFVPYLRGGAEFTLHNQDIMNNTTGAKESYNGSAFGLVGGGGTQFLIGTRFMTALDFSYHGVFEAKTSVGGREVKTIESFYTVMLQFGYRFGGDR